MCLLIVFPSAWIGRARLSDLRPQEHALATHPDVRAAGWIAANTPQNARFLVNSFFAYGGSLIAGSDGGWWLPLLARRPTTQPPINYVTELGPRPDYVEWVNQVPAQILSAGIDTPETLDLLRRREISYVYIGQQRGSTNASENALLDPQRLLKSPAFRPVYHQDRVWIFEIVR